MQESNLRPPDYDSGELAATPIRYFNGFILFPVSFNAFRITLFLTLVNKKVLIFNRKMTIIQVWMLKHLLADLNSAVKKKD